MSRLTASFLLLASSLCSLPTCVSSFSLSLFSDSACTIEKIAPFVSDNAQKPLDGRCVNNTADQTSGWILQTPIANSTLYDLQVQGWSGFGCPQNQPLLMSVMANNFEPNQCTQISLFANGETADYFGQVDFSNALWDQRQMEQLNTMNETLSMNDTLSIIELVLVETVAVIPLDPAVLEITTPNATYFIPSYVIDEPFFGSANFSSYNYTFKLDFILQVPIYIVTNVTQEADNSTVIDVTPSKESIPVFEIDPLNTGLPLMNPGAWDPSMSQDLMPQPNMPQQPDMPSMADSPMAAPAVVSAPIPAPVSVQASWTGQTQQVSGSVSISASSVNGSVTCSIQTPFVNMMLSGGNCTSVQTLNQAMGGSVSQYIMGQAPNCLPFSLWNLQQQIQRHIQAQVGVQYNITDNMNMQDIPDAMEASVLCPSTNGSIQLNYTFAHTVGDANVSLSNLGPDGVSTISVAIEAGQNAVNCSMSLENGVYLGNGSACTDTDYHAQVMMGDMLAGGYDDQIYLLEKQQRPQGEQPADVARSMAIGVGVGGGVLAVLIAGFVFVRRSKQTHAYLPTSTR